MWKESLCIGVEFIDNQHKELFELMEKLVQIINTESHEESKNECIAAIAFLEGYAIRHFAAEEEYQISIRYSDILAHKALHRAFATTVGKMDRKLKEADFSVPVVKEFAGFISAWLTYHIAGIDQKLKKKEHLTTEQTTALSSYVQCFARSAQDVLEAIAGLSSTNVTYDTWSGSNDDIRVMIGLLGDYKGEAVFTFPREMTLSLVKSLTSFELPEVDEMAYSAISEISNIISGNASRLIAGEGKDSDIKIPRRITDFSGTDNRSGFYMDTDLGRLAISVNIG